MNVSKSLVRVVILFCFIFLGIYPAAAQNIDKKNFWRFGVDASLGENQGALNLYSDRIWGLGKSGRFLLGAGFRLTAQRGNSLVYLTAPASITKGATGPQVLFLDEKPDQIDTINLTQSSLLAGNFSFLIGYKITPKFEAGFTIDLVGLTIGAKQKGKFESSDATNLSGQEFEARPTPFNALLIAENDIGTLQSQFYLSYMINSSSALKLGVSYLFTEYTSTQKLANNNDRFRNTVLMGMIGYSYTLP